MYKGIPVSVEMGSAVPVLTCDVCGEELGTIPPKYLAERYNCLYDYLCKRRLHIIDHLESHVAHRRNPPFSIPTIRKIRV